MIKNKPNLQLLFLVCMNYFTLALITNIPGALLPYWRESFSLNSTLVSFLSSAFFLAYGLTSLPQGLLLDKIGNKKTFLWGIFLVILGSATFAFFPRYEVGLISLFITGIGITALQLAGNLAVKKIDKDPDKYSRNLTLTQIFCGIGGLGGGFLIGYLIKDLGFQWQSIYLIFAGLAVVLALFTAATKISETQKEENSSKISYQDYLKLAKNPLMRFFAFGIFIYVGIEVGVATWIASFLVNNHHFSKASAAGIVGLYWGFQSVGRFSGGFVLNYIETSKALIIYTVGCLASLLAAAYAPSGHMSAIAFISVGFFTSIMFPSIFSLAVNSFDKKQEGVVAGVLCTAIVGGAVISPLIGLVSDMTNSLALGLTIVGSVSLFYIAFLGMKTLKKTSGIDAGALNAKVRQTSLKDITAKHEDKKEKVQVK